MEDNSEDRIHELYANHEKQRLRTQKEMRQMLESQTPTPFYGRQAYWANNARWTTPSFRSQWFFIGDGVRVLPPGSTIILAQKTVPAQHVGVLTGLSQMFMECDPEVINTITWGLRIDGMPIRDFPDFIGEYSKPYAPMQVYFILAGGAQTLGTVSVSPGSESPYPDNIPTVYLQATNNHPNLSAILQARLIGYTNPVAERHDEYANL